MKPSGLFDAFGTGMTFASLVLVCVLADVRAAAAQAEGNVALLRQIYLARAGGFAALQGQLAENDFHGKAMQEGIARPFHMRCRIAVTPSGPVYGCTSRTSPTSESSGLSDDDAKALYASVQDALRAACSGVTSWSQGQSTSEVQEQLGAIAPGQVVATASLVTRSADGEADDASVDFSIYATPIARDPLAQAN